jgi:hypothetical protein
MRPGPPFPASPRRKRSRRWSRTRWPAAPVAGLGGVSVPLTLAASRCQRPLSSTTGLRAPVPTSGAFPRLPRWPCHVCWPCRPTSRQMFAVMLLGGSDGLERGQDGQCLKVWPSCMVARPTWAKLRMTGLLMFPQLGQAKLHLGHGGLWGARWPSWRDATARSTPAPPPCRLAPSPAHQPARPGLGAASAPNGPRPGPASPAFPTWRGRSWPACPGGTRLPPGAPGCQAPGGSAAHQRRLR